MSIRVDINQQKIVDFCSKWKISEFALFGSVLRDDFGPESDIDVLVQFANDTRYTLLDIAVIQDELACILGRRVDLVERSAIERSENYIRHKHTLEHLEKIYIS